MSKSRAMMIQNALDLNALEVKALRAAAADAHLSFEQYCRLMLLAGVLAELIALENDPGKCRVCGCTSLLACEGGCEWVNDEHTLCSSCAGTVADA